jgi:hypothetical protein
MFNTSSLHQSQPASLTQPPNNDDFLDVMFGDNVHEAFVCSNTTPPDTDNELAKAGMWVGGPIEFARDLYQDPQRQNYTCVSTFRRDAEDVYRRQIEYFEALHFIVLDDIGTKVKIDPRTLGFGDPSAIIETSPWNQQWFYRLTEPVRDVSLAHFLTKQVLATPVQGHLMTDQGAKGITRLCKLPQGRNLKQALGQPWQNKMVSWRPTLAYSAWEVAAWFGQSLDHVPQINAMPAAAALLSGEHPLIEALQEADLLKSAQQKNSGWWDIQCLQRHLHTKGVDDGAAVKVRADGSWTMKCQHGHCADLKARDLYRWLVEQGLSVTPPQYRLHVKRIDPARLPFNAPVLAEDDFSFLDPDDGGAGDELNYPDPEVDIEMASEALPAGGDSASVCEPERPRIFVDPGLIPSILKQCAKLLEHHVFKRGHTLVRIGHAAELHDGLSRLATQPVVLAVNRQWLMRELSELAIFNRLDRRINDYKVVDCPMNIAIALELGTDDDTFSHLTVLANAPFLRADGSICETLGYDAETGIYYAPNLEFPPQPIRPGWKEGRAALDELLDLVKQFPFAGHVSRSVFLADVLTALARPTLPKSPMVLYTATMAGSGKTLMASIANLIAYGHATTHPWPGANEEELKKVFTSVLLAGDPVVVFDNLPNGALVKSAALSQFVTSDDYADRKLGESERVKFRNRSRLGVTSLKDFVNYAKKNPGQLNCGIPGTGTSFHFNNVLMAQKLGIETRYVPYKGEGQILSDIAAGSLQYALVSNTGKTFVDAGQVTALAVTSEKRVSSLPQVPTFKESGVEFTTDGWVGYVVAKGTPRPIVSRLNLAFVQALNTPALKQRLQDMGYQVVGGTPGHFVSEVQKGNKKFGDLFRSGAVKLE